MSGLHFCSTTEFFFSSKNLIGQFCSFCNTKIHSWFRGWEEWNRRNELFSPESQCNFFCFTPLSLESLTWILITRIKLAHFVMLVWKLLNLECKPKRIRDNKIRSVVLNRVAGWTIVLQTGSGFWRPRRHTSCMSPPPGALIVEGLLYYSWGGSRRGGGEGELGGSIEPPKLKQLKSRTCKNMK